MWPKIIMDIENIWQIAIAVAVFLIVLILGIWAIRRVGSAVSGRRGSRLAVSEVQSIDKNRHLVLVRCDDEEHLLLVGGSQDLVVKTNVTGNDLEYIDQPVEYEARPASVEPTFSPAQPAPETSQSRYDPGTSQDSFPAPESSSRDGGIDTPRTTESPLRGER